MNFEEGKIYRGDWGRDYRVFKWIVGDDECCPTYYSEYASPEILKNEYITRMYDNIRLANPQELEEFYAAYPELKAKDMKIEDVIVNNDNQENFEKIQQWFFDQNLSWSTGSHMKSYKNLRISDNGQRIQWDGDGCASRTYINTQEFMDKFMQDSTEYTLADFLAGKFEVKFDTPICKSPNFDKVKSWVDKKRNDGVDCSNVDYQDTNQYLATGGSGGMMSLNYGCDEKSITEEQFIKLIDEDMKESLAAKVKYGILYRDSTSYGEDGYSYFKLSHKNSAYYEGIYYSNIENFGFTYCPSCASFSRELKEVTEETPHINRVKHMFATKEYISQEDFDALAAKVEPKDARTGYYRVRLENNYEDTIIYLENGIFISWRDISNDRRKVETETTDMTLQDYGWNLTQTKPATEEEIAWLNTEGENLEDYLAAQQKVVEKEEFTEYDVFHVKAGKYEYLVRQDDTKNICEWLDLSDGRYGVDGSDFKDYPLRDSTPDEKARFYNQFGYKSDTGEVWEVGDKFNVVGGGRDDQSQEIKNFFETGVGSVSAATDENSTRGFGLEYFDNYGFYGEKAVRITKVAEEKVAEVQEKPDIPGYDVVDFREPALNDKFVNSNPNGRLRGEVMYFMPSENDSSEYIQGLCRVGVIRDFGEGKKRWIVKKKPLFAKYESLINYLEEEGITEEKVRDAFSPPKVVKTDTFEHFEPDVYIADEIEQSDKKPFASEGDYKFTQYISAPAVGKTQSLGESMPGTSMEIPNQNNIWRQYLNEYCKGLSERGTRSWFVEPSKTVSISEKTIDNKPLWYRILKTTKKILIG